MANKKNKYIPKLFESMIYITPKYGKKQLDTSANIYESMLLSSAWKDLTVRQKLLYLYCKSQYYSEKHYKLKEKKDNPEIFTMNQYKWSKKYELYTISNSSQFYKDMEGLINHGFIKCIKCGAISRQRNIYAFSDKWKIWGTKEFKIERNEMTLRMINKLASDQ